MDRPLVAVIPGDDAAPEAMAATMTVLRHLDPPVDWDELPPGAELAAIEPTEREAFVHARIDAADTVLFGSTNGTTPGVRAHALGAPDVRQRPARSAGSPATARRWPRPEGIDYVIVRENLEDAYVGIMGDAADLLAAGPGRPAGPARQRGRGPLRGEGHHPGRHRAGGPVLLRAGPAPAGSTATRAQLTVSAKTNMLPTTDRWFCDIVAEVGRRLPRHRARALHRRRHGPPPRPAPPRARRACCCRTSTATS